MTIFRNHLGSLLVALVAWGGLTWVGCGSNGATPDAAGPDAAPDAEAVVFDHPARVLRIIDGDTLEVSYLETALTIRLHGIDTPELSPTPEPFAEEARQFTIQYATPAITVGLEFDDEACGAIPFPSTCFDLYDRMLAYIRTREGYDLNALLVANGLAQVYLPADFERKAEYLDLQQEAQSQGLGIWSQ